MASKKRKVDFSADAILSEVSQAREFAQNVQQFRKTLNTGRATSRNVVQLKVFGTGEI